MTWRQLGTKALPTQLHVYWQLAFWDKSWWIWSKRHFLKKMRTETVYYERLCLFWPKSVGTDCLRSWKKRTRFSYILIKTVLMAWLCTQPKHQTSQFSRNIPALTPESSRHTFLKLSIRPKPPKIQGTCSQPQARFSTNSHQMWEHAMHVLGFHGCQVAAFFRTRFGCVLPGQFFWGDCDRHVAILKIHGARQWKKDWNDDDMDK